MQIRIEITLNSKEESIGLPMINVLGLTLEWTSGEVIVNYGTGSSTPCFSLDSPSVTQSEYVFSYYIAKSKTHFTLHFMDHGTVR
jgi:hypothetical protein